MAEQEEYDGFAVVEIMGKVRLAGHLRDVEICGTKMWRLDIPGGEPVTKYYGSGAIFGFTPCDEATVLRVLSAMDDAEPVHVWELPRPALAAAPGVVAGFRRADEHEGVYGTWTCERCDYVTDIDDDGVDVALIANQHAAHCEPF